MASHLDWLLLLLYCLLAILQAGLSAPGIDAFAVSVLLFHGLFIGWQSKNVVGPRRGGF